MMQKYKTPKYICENCGSSDVEEMEWHKVNTGEYSGQCDLTNNTWCCACETHCAIIDESDKEKVE